MDKDRKKILERKQVGVGRKLNCLKKVWRPGPAYVSRWLCSVW